MSAAFKPTTGAGREKMPRTPLRTVAVGQHTVTIYQDPNPENPRKMMDPLGTFAVKANRHFSGDRDATQDEVRALLADPKNVALPVYALVHGGVSLSTSPFSCPWDSGMCGVIFLPWETAKAQGFKSRKAASAALASEIETYSAWLEGAVFGYEVTDPHGDHMDSCWGFYGPGVDYCVEEGTAVARSHDAALCERQKSIVDALGALVGGGEI